MCVYTSSVHKTMKANETCHSCQELAQCINSVNTIIKSHVSRQRHSSFVRQQYTIYSPYPVGRDMYNMAGIICHCNPWFTSDDRRYDILSCGDMFTTLSCPQCCPVWTLAPLLHVHVCHLLCLVIDDKLVQELVLLLQTNNDTYMGVRQRTYSSGHIETMHLFLFQLIIL